MTNNGASLTYDRHHARGRFAAKHALARRSDSYYEWDGVRRIWYGRVYVRFQNRPPGELRLIRAETDGHLDCAVDVSPSGRLRFVDAENRTVMTTSKRVAVRQWVRIEVRVDHRHGTVIVKLFNRPDGSTPTQVIRATSAAIGASANQFQFGRSGHEPFAFRFWTDDPGLSSSGYLGAG
ncbi:MAG: hypothetical protein ACRDH7_03670 [Actinomycetota bacterium]